MDTFDRTWQGTEPLLSAAINELKADTPRYAIRQLPVLRYL